MRKFIVSLAECHEQSERDHYPEHKDVLHSCAKLLLEKEKVHRDEFEALFTRENSVDRKPKYINTTKKACRIL